MKIYFKNKIRHSIKKFIQNIHRIKIIIKTFLKRKGPYVY